MNNYFLQLHNVSKRFVTSSAQTLLSRLLRKKVKASSKALDSVSFEAHQGEVIGVVGGNGSGKTTLLKIIAGIFAQTSGAVFIHGTSLYISGFGSLINKGITLRDNLKLLGAVSGLSAHDVQTTIPEILAEAELTEYENSLAAKLSNGMLARLAFFSMMKFVEGKTPDIILLDEAISAGGDERFKHAVIKKIRSLAESGSTVLLVSHTLSIVAEVCQRTLWLKDGSIHMDGATADVITTYKNEVAAAVFNGSLL